MKNVSFTINKTPKGAFVVESIVWRDAASPIKNFVGEFPTRADAIVAMTVVYDAIEE